MLDGSSQTRNLRALCGACSFSLAVCLCVAVVAAACDDSFDPYAPSDLAFSVYGYLDAAADTQWIRVMPIRPLKVTSQDPLGATVTLENIGTGQIIELRDSLFEFSSYYVHNFWTLEDIEPGASYLFSATREGEEPAEAVVEIPGDYEVEVAINQFPTYWAPEDELRITGVKHLPFLTTATYFYDLCGSSMTRTQYAGRSADDETYLIEIRKPSVTPRFGCDLPIVPNWELWVVGSEAEWPARGYSPDALGEPGRTSNVTNAVGFLGGVLSKVIPYEYCRFQSDGAPVPDYCLLRYGPETATVSGIVSETRCRDGPLDSVTVRLTEMDRDPARIRNIRTNAAGEFVIGALEPGIAHSLFVRAPMVPSDSIFDLRTFSYVYTEWKDVHTLPTDTLTFTPGQQLEYDIALERLTPCSEPPPEEQ